MLQKVEAATNYINSKVSNKPKIGLILGSGLGEFVDLIQNKKSLSYGEIPNFFKTTIEGHSGQLIFGTLSGIEIVVMQGRVHLYEGHAISEVSLPTRVLCTLGIKNLILTNAAGGINASFAPGDLIAINDHINLMGRNPLIGPNVNEWGPRFPDMSFAYNPELISAIKASCEELRYPFKQGVYCALSGPTYETPAEIRMLRTLGADMVGMSTVPETIVANHMGIKVAGISCITNMAAGISKVKLSHDDIKEVATKSMSNFKNILKKSIEKIG